MGMLQGKVAIVTGASRGIGAEAARVFAREGATVVLAARSPGDIESNALDIVASGGTALAVQTDVTDPASVERMVERAVTAFGHVDVAFNNAGAGHRPRPLAEISVEDFDAILKSNLLSVFLSMKYEIPAMLAHGGGAIVNMSSTAGMQGAPGMGSYSAAKHGVIGLSLTAALDYGRRNIRVNAIAPGPIATADLPEQARAHIAEFVPMGTLGTPEQVALAAAWLCSDQAAFVHGAVLSVDGGRLAGAFVPAA
ncbi:MAG TPA: SDR family NAD(P)-dependent oxidoreductase [Candidatus Dormibacteraeota bacterium]